MSGNSEPSAFEPETIAPLSHRRILWTMAIIVFVGAIASFVFISRQFGAGFTIGGSLAFLNYYWLKRSLKKIFDGVIASAETGEKPRFLAVNYFLRYLGVGALIYIVYLTEAVSMVAVLLGLCVFAVAIVIEGFIRMFSSISKREEF
jgi:hypothetical protein